MIFRRPGNRAGGGGSGLRVPLAAALALGALVTAPGRPQLAPQDRDPIAVELGTAPAPEWRRPAATLVRSHDGPDLLRAAPPDSLVAVLMDSTSLPRMVAVIQRLQDFGTRYVVTDSCRAAGYWLRDQLVELGYEGVRVDTFRTMSFQDSVDAFNVIAVKEGTTVPSEHVVLGGHYDSVSAENFTDPDAPAPGAEDNATAVAAVLEAARLLRDVPTDRSIIFALWSAEEVGTWGSRAFVAGAVAESLDIIVYLNMDCIGYLEPSPGAAPITVYTDSLSLGIAGYMQTLAHAYTGYDVQTTVQPFGASDHNSFWRVGYNVVDTGTTISSPYRHTADDILENVDPEFARAMAAVNVATTAAVAGVSGEDPNLPPETITVECCAAATSPVTMTPTFAWSGVDFDGTLARYEYTVEADTARLVRGGSRARLWEPLPPEQTSITLTGLDEGTYRFGVRAVDDAGVADPSPVWYEFTTDASLRPLLKVETNFLPETFVFTGDPLEDPHVEADVFEGELLEFRIASDASAYCGVADSVSWSISGSFEWSAWAESPHELVLRPDAGYSAVYLRTRDENGAVTGGSVTLNSVPAPMDVPLLHVDDWFGGDVPEGEHDAFYQAVLAGESCDVWDPYEHIEGYEPTLPPMEELGRYRTVLWTLGRNGGLLRAAQAETAYHHLEGFVRAGGNVIIEGQSALTTLGGADHHTYQATYGPGEFIHDHGGIDSLRNAGVGSNPSNPESYGYAFLGGVATGAENLPDAPVDTLGKWADGYETYGGLPFCEIVRPVEGTSALYRFDSYLNQSLDGRTCATLRLPDDGTGAFAHLGFPLYYLQTEPAAEMLERLLDSIERWQRPATLLYLDWSATAESVTLTWCLLPPEEPAGCLLERAPADQPGDYHALHDGLLQPWSETEYRFVDGSVEPATGYLYRLTVTERWGGMTTHGPWEIATFEPWAAWLECPSPNPFGDDLNIHYGIASTCSRASLEVFDVAGRRVKTLREGPADPGEHDAAWDGTNESGERVGSGVYFVRLRAGRSSIERKVVLLK